MSEERREPETLYGNFQFSITGQEQEEIQNFLRRINPKDQQNPAWKLLHEITYAWALGDYGWTDTPQYEVLKVEEPAEQDTFGLPADSAPISNTETTAAPVREETAAPLKAFHVERSTITKTYEITTVNAVDEWAARLLAERTADALEWTETDEDTEVDFFAEDQEEHDRKIRAFLDVK